jgi:asparagine synthase (glutamine-hydrolysing)
MCGIAGIFKTKDNSFQESDLLEKMTEALVHRGPDGFGFYKAQNCGLGHRRLAIIDLTDAAQQPFTSANGRYVITYNGEIYNFKELASELQADGVQLKSNSDTEVLIECFNKYGTDLLPRLRGMFAFAIYDTRERSITLARDRMGVKPLYYALQGNTYFFASEQKALFSAGIPIILSIEGIKESIFNRFATGEHTLFAQVQKVLPGHFLKITEQGYTSQTRWWNLEDEIRKAPKIKDPVGWFSETFDESVALRMVSDVPVGLMLSGGLDSSAIAASLFTQQFKNTDTFNIAFAEKEHNESHLAKNLAQRFDFKHNEIELNGSEFYNNLLQAINFQDEPLTHLSEPHLLALSKMAKKHVKVLLSGEGADEIFGGYVRYKPLAYPSLMRFAEATKIFELFAGTKRLEKLARYSKIKNNDELILWNGSNLYPEDIKKHYKIADKPENIYRFQILEEAKRLYPNNLQRQALYFDQHTYLCSLLDRNDRCTMGASIECREPFLDHKILIGAGSLDSKWLFQGKKGKYVQKEALKSRLPKEILEFKKVGLSAPYAKYLTQIEELRTEVDALRNSPIFDFPIFKNIPIKVLLEQFYKNPEQQTPIIIPLLIFHLWHKMYEKNFGSIITNAPIEFI